MLHWFILWFLETRNGSRVFNKYVGPLTHEFMMSLTGGHRCVTPWPTNFHVTRSPLLPTKNLLYLINRYVFNYLSLSICRKHFPKNFRVSEIRSFRLPLFFVILQMSALLLPNSNNLNDAIIMKKNIHNKKSSVEHSLKRKAKSK